MSSGIGLSDGLQHVALDRQCWEMHQAWKLTLVNLVKLGHVQSAEENNDRHKKQQFKLDKGLDGKGRGARARGRNGWRGVGSTKPQNYIQRSHVCKVLGGPATKPSESNKLHPRSRSAVRPPGSRVSHSISLMECFSMASFGKGSGSPRQQFQHIGYGFLIFGNGVGLEEPPGAFARPVEGLRWQSLCPPTNPANESICCLTRKLSPVHTLVEIVSGRG